ncbi:MAG: hypothetical protein HY904_02440 [Deltaproteobacteria bacterium]|nr:hypothetical protein [Deltaproteobacteria bacterium]
MTPASAAGNHAAVRPATALLVTAVLLSPGPSRAGGQYELFGVNPRGKGMAGAMTAHVDDASATYYNPAGLAELTAAYGFVALAGNLDVVYVDLVHRLPLQDWRRPNSPENYAGLTLGGAVPLGGKFNRIIIGASAYAPRKHVLTVRTLDPAQPHFYFYEAQPDRYELLPAVALRVTDYVKLGAGLRMGGGIRGPTQSEMDPLLGRTTRAQFDGELYYVFAPTGGATLGPFWGFRVGATVRGPVQVPIDIPNTIHAAGADADVTLLFRANTNYTPPTGSVGVAWTGFMDKLTVAADLQYSWWSLAPDPSVRFVVDAAGADLGTVGLDDAVDTPQPGQERKVHLGFRSILVPRAGFEWRAFDDFLRVRGGSYLRPTPVPDQTTGSNYLDNHAWAVTGSLGVRPSDPVGLVARPVTLEASLQVVTLVERRVRKRDSDDAVGNYRFGGQVYEASVGFHYNF